MSLKDYDFKKIGLFFSFLLIISGGIIGAVSGVYYFNKFQTNEKRFREASVVNQADVESLVAKVGKLIKLPEDELPTVATVTDLERLKDQPFFAKAKVGDKVLLYPQAKKAILYDPLNNLIVEVGPLIIPTATPPLAQATGAADVAGLATQSTPAAQPLKIAIYNSTNNTSLINNFETLLNEKVPDVEVSVKTKAAKSNYAKSIVVDLTGKNKEAVENLSRTLNLEISALSSEEKSPAASDILIILGSDRL